MPRNNEGRKRTAKERLYRGVGVTLIAALGAGALGACGNGETASADNKATTTATATATPGASEAPTATPEVPKGINYEVDPHTTEAYKNLSDSDKAFFDARWDAPITPESYNDNFESRVKMSKITAEAFAEIVNNTHREERYDLSAFGASYEQVARDPNLAVSSVQERMRLANDLITAAARTYNHNLEAGVPESEVTQYSARAAEHIKSGLLKVWSTEDKEEPMVPSAPMIKYAEQVNAYFIEVYNRALNGESASAYTLPFVYTEDPMSFYTQGDQVEYVGGEGSYPIGNLVYDVRGYTTGAPYTDRYGVASIRLISPEDSSDAWAVGGVSYEPIGDNRPIEQ